MLLRAATDGPAGAAAVLTLLVLFLGRAGSVAAARPLWQQQGNGPGRTYASAVEVPIPEQPVDALELQWTWFDQNALMAPTGSIFQQSLVLDGFGNVYAFLFTEAVSIVCLSANGTQEWLTAIAKPNENYYYNLLLNTEGDVILVSLYPIASTGNPNTALGLNTSDGSLKWTTSIPRADGSFFIISPLIMSNTFVASSVEVGDSGSGYKFGLFVIDAQSGSTSPINLAGFPSWSSDFVPLWNNIVSDEMFLYCSVTINFPDGEDMTIMSAIVAVSANGATQGVTQWTIYSSPRIFDSVSSISLSDEQLLSFTPLSDNPISSNLTVVNTDGSYVIPPAASSCPYSTARFGSKFFCPSPYLQAFNINSGERLWMQNIVGGTPNTFLVADSAGTLFANTASSLIAVNGTTGDIIFEAPLNVPSPNSMVIGLGGMIIVSSSFDGSVSAFLPARSTPSPTSSPSASSSSSHTSSPSASQSQSPPQAPPASNSAAAASVPALSAATGSLGTLLLVGAAFAVLQWRRGRNAPAAADAEVEFPDAQRPLAGELRVQA